MVVQTSSSIFDYQPGVGGSCKKSALVWLRHFGLIEVKGSEAVQFLQNILTSDVRLVSGNRGQFSSWCDGKGRINATFWLIPFENAFFMILPKAHVSNVLPRLRMFVLRAKVELRDVSEDLKLIGILEPLDAMNTHIVRLPVNHCDVMGFDGGSVMALTGAGATRYLVLGKPGNIDSWVSSSLPEVPEQGIAVWQLADILAGIPMIEKETAGEFIPQMLDLEVLGALSFTKGCYPGQEVVARLKYRGQLKRKICRAIISTAELPARGSRLASSNTDESVGTLLAAEHLDPGRILALAVVVTEQKEKGSVHLHTPDGPELIFESNPN